MSAPSTSLYGCVMETTSKSKGASDLLERATHHEQVLLKRYGPMIQGADLLQVAGYPNSEALRQAIRRQTVGFSVFTIPGRRGRFARSSDVAHWLAEIDTRIGLPNHPPQGGPMT